MPQRDLACPFYRQGVEAMGRSEWDRALELFVRCLRLEPHNFMYRQLAEKCSDKRNSRL
jgi:hypothetical protein